MMQRLSQRQQYQHLMYGLLVAGILGLLIGVYFNQFVAGVLLYWVGFFGMLSVWQLSPVLLYDERDIAIERKASDWTLSIFAFVLVLGAPSGLILEHGGVLTLPNAFHGAMWVLVTVYIVFGVIYTILRQYV
ncbi:hypothetical protein C497_06594 [Halalkalicoccus jeotgali B3]|uniref:DUF2178 domain-containing protein n=2 Tax=Halalkalicoccus jeotgali TaxID=413810 RepID=D8JCA1_HALJB|nr:hypothetical protein [Halalkalicoccus jeotgali]ADJ17008.1 hypothetical protein HacjB3_18328 [Halalkalicoccus jeotgali B3]ELY38830.1 hypothetical protein C497_06594 [Halalkalicoccus jeotgali B3]